MDLLSCGVDPEQPGKGFPVKNLLKVADRVAQFEDAVQFSGDGFSPEPFGDEVEQVNRHLFGVFD